MAHIPHGPLGEPIRNMKELGQLLCGVGYLFGFLSILLLVIMLYAKSYKSSKELLLIVGIPGAISLISLALGSIFRKIKSDPRFQRSLAQRNRTELNEKK